MNNMLFTKSFNDLNENDLIELINNKTIESKFIDYKKEIHSNSDSEKKEFLADVSSFSNSSGGYLLIGIEEKNGIPSNLSPLNINSDKEISRLEAIIKDGIVPRITGINIRPIDISDSGVVIAIKIPTSFSIPHMIKYQETNKFYARNSNGKYLLDYNEIRDLFSNNLSLTDHIKKFRIERLMNIENGDIPTSIIEENQPKLILHIIPLQNRILGKHIDLKKIKTSDYDLITIDNYSSHHINFNFDGIFITNEDEEYTQIFRDGTVELIWYTLFKPFKNYEKLISVAMLEFYIVRAIRYYLNLMKDIFEIEPPFCIFLTLLNVKNFMIPNKSTRLDIGNNIIKKDDLILQEIVLENDNNIGENLKPVFDIIYNSAGLEGSYHYDQNGKWTGDQEWKNIIY